MLSHANYSARCIRGIPGPVLRRILSAFGRLLSSIGSRYHHTQDTPLGNAQGAENGVPDSLIIGGRPFVRGPRGIRMFYEYIIKRGCE